MWCYDVPFLRSQKLQTDTDTQTHTCTHKHTDRHTDTQTHTCTHGVFYRDSTCFFQEKVSSFYLEEQLLRASGGQASSKQAPSKLQEAKAKGWMVSAKMAQRI